MPAASYGNYSPREDQPYPIESELAKLAVTSPAQAQNMLDTYQLQRATAGGNYDLAMQGQHDFARQQLAQQLYEARLKAAPEFFKTPGMARLVGSQGLIPGVSDDDLGPSVQQAENAIGATNLEHAGSGVNAMSQAGYGIPIPAVQNMTGITGIVPQTPRDIQVANINAAGRVAAANAGAGGGLGYSIQLPVTEATGNTPVTVSVPKKFGGGLPGAISQLRQAGALPTPVQPPPPDGATPPPAAPTPPAAPSKSITNLPMAKKDTGRPVQNSAPGADQIQQRAQQFVETQLRTQNPAMYKDVMAYAATNGGKVGLIGPDKNGRYQLQGKERNY